MLQQKFKVSAKGFKGREVTSAWRKKNQKQLHENNSTFERILRWARMHTGQRDQQRGRAQI